MKDEENVLRYFRVYLSTCFRACALQDRIAG
jgi:hypothetical protein